MILRYGSIPNTKRGLSASFGRSLQEVSGSALLPRAPCLKGSVQRMHNDLIIRGGIRIPSSAMQWTASRSGGAGGQHVNTTESRVQLRVRFQECTTIPVSVRTRLAQQKPHWFTARGELLMSCGTHRSRQRNQDELLDRLRNGLLAALQPPKSVGRQNQPKEPEAAITVQEVARGDQKESGARPQARRRLAYFAQQLTRIGHEGERAVFMKSDNHATFRLAPRPEPNIDGVLEQGIVHESLQTQTSYTLARTVGLDPHDVGGSGDWARIQTRHRRLRHQTIHGRPTTSSQQRGLENLSPGTTPGVAQKMRRPSPSGSAAVTSPPYSDGTVAGLPSPLEETGNMTPPLHASTGACRPAKRTAVA